MSQKVVGDKIGKNMPVHLNRQDNEIQKPIRTCIGCGRKNTKSHLARVVMLDEIIVLDENQRLPGRGVYVCWSQECLNKALRHRQFHRFFKKHAGEYIIQPVFHHRFAECIASKEE